MTFYTTFSSALLDVNQSVPDTLKAWNGNDASHRFNVYRNNVMVSLLDALQATFPVTAQLTGMAFFRAMARHYVLQSPPRTPVLAWYGDTFPEFIAGFSPAASLPYLADVAQLEFAWLSCFHSADRTPVTPQALSCWLASNEQDDPGSDSSPAIELAPSTRVVVSPYPLFSIWSAHQPDSVIHFPDIDFSQAQNVLLTRPGYVVHLDLVPDGAAHCLLRARQGVLSSEVFEAPDFDLPALLALLIEREAVVGLSNIKRGMDT